MAKKSGLGFLAALLLLGLPIVLSPWRIQGPVKLPNSQVKSDRWFPHLRKQMSYPDMAADAAMEPTGENYIGVRYKALLVEDELSETGWVLLFGGSGFTVNGEYQPHFIDLMIKAGWASLYDDPLCDDGFPSPERCETILQFSSV